MMHSCYSGRNTKEGYKLVSSSAVTLRLDLNTIDSMLGKNDYARLKEMGFSRDEIDKAAKIAAERKVDLLDVLTKFNGASNTSQNQQQNQPQKYLIRCHEVLNRSDWSTHSCTVHSSNHAAKWLWTSTSASSAKMTTHRQAISMTEGNKASQ